MKNGRCFNCIHSRLIYNSKERSRYVGCCKHNGDEESLLESLSKANYTNIENAKEVRYGWIYANLPPTANRKNFDHTDAGVLANLCLITPYESYCDLFEPR